MSWASLGHQGRIFVAGGPNVDELTKFNGAPAIEPIRAYAGLGSADGIRATAEMAARELQRTGGLNRKVVAVATTTGTGWINEAEASALEYMYNGDTAIVSMQYSFLPSWMSFLVDKENARQAGQALFEAVDELVRAMPEGKRPKLVVFGESLGSFGGEAPFLSLNNLVARTDGALFSGPTFNNTIWTEPHHEPRCRFADVAADLRQGRERAVRRTPGQPRPAHRRRGARRGWCICSTRPIPIAWWTPNLLFREPDWLREPRGYDVSPRMDWIPVVTFLQVSADMAVAVDVPDGHGHGYVRDVVNGWAAVLQPPGWTPEKTERLRPIDAAPTDLRPSTPAGHQRVVAADDVGGPVQTEVLQRGGGQARGVALRAQDHPFDVIAGGLRQARIAGGVAAPFEHVAFDDQRRGHLALGGALGGGPDVDEHRAAAQRVRALRRRTTGAAGPGRRRARRRFGSLVPLGVLGQLGALAAQGAARGDLVVRHRGQRRRVGVHAQRRPGSRSGRRPRPHHVVHPAQRKGGLVTGIKSPPTQSISVPTEFVKRAGQDGQRTQRAAVVVQFGRMTGHPADQPDVEFVVTVQAGEPAIVGGQPAGGQQVVVAAVEHVGGRPVGGVQQVG